MKQKNIIKAIRSLAEVVKANNNVMLGSDGVLRMANEKIKELIPKIKA